MIGFEVVNFYMTNLPACAFIFKCTVVTERLKYEAAIYFEKPRLKTTCESIRWSWFYNILWKSTSSLLAKVTKKPLCWLLKMLYFGWLVPKYFFWVGQRKRKVTKKPLFPHTPTKKRVCVGWWGNPILTAATWPYWAHCQRWEALGNCDNNKDRRPKAR